MQYTQLGETGINISKICVGCMSFGKPGTIHDWTLDEEGTDAGVAHALDLGIIFFDTANGYSDGTSEEYLGKALSKHTSRERVVIASKVYFNEGRFHPRPSITRSMGRSSDWVPTTWTSTSSTDSTMKRP
ncbi:aldo/keto reductase [Bifidobacterium sp. H6bp9]|uniref:aldo/keto reductase n=1 Tax=Bifidobacterium sp. H6bp9 TaxID=3051961 RepID=UPI0028BE01FF|nr:aldo/keto reductase [Bifidobacterium sp. H6bp9]MDT7510590.1 aldo/keto reductase [Bifidobacterium sp. H6bp9]